MAFPANLDTIVVRHKITDAAGRPLKGNTVTAEPAERVWATDGSIVQYRAATQIDANGQWELELPYVDQEGIRNKGVPWRVTEHVPGRPKSYFVAPVLAHGAGPIDAAECLVSAPTSRETVIQAGPVTDEAAASLLAQDGEFKAALMDTIAAEVVHRAGTVPIFGSQAEAQAWEDQNPGRSALWFDAGYITVTPAGPTWTDDVLGGGTWTTPDEEGVTYSPASGTADPGQTVTVTATPDPGYVLIAPTTWTHTFPEVPDTIFTDFTDAPVDEIPDGWTQRWVIPTGIGWRIEQKLSATGGQALVHRGADNARRLLSWDLADALDTTDVEVVFKWSTSNNNPAHVIVRGAGDAGAETGYRAGVRNASTQSLSKFVDGTSTLPIGPEAPFTLAADVWFITRFRIEGDQLRARNWRADEPEPTEWTLTVTDSSITQDGWVGLLAFGGGVMSYDWIGLAVNGKTAPKGD